MINKIYTILLIALASIMVLAVTIVTFVRECYLSIGDMIKGA